MWTLVRWIRKRTLKSRIKAMYAEEVHGQGSLSAGDAAGWDGSAPSVDEDKVKKRKKRIHGKLHPHKKKSGGT